MSFTAAAVPGISLPEEVRQRLADNSQIIVTVGPDLPRLGMICEDAMLNEHFTASRLDPESAIVQRRSGKTKLVSSKGQPFLDTVDPSRFYDHPAEVLESGKVIAQSLTRVLDYDARLFLARSFCASVIETFWSSIQADEAEIWPLPNHFLPQLGTSLAEPAASLARAMGKAAAQIDIITASYLIGVTYTAMLPDEARSRLGVYYTPPGLARRLLDIATQAGVDWTSCRVCDPACGGGAFLAPVAAKIAEENTHLSPRELLQTIATRLRGFEIDPFAAWASQVFLEVTLLGVCREAGVRVPPVVEICNSLLRESTEETFDLVIGNPPYGRVTLKPELRKRYQRSLYGHANLYGLFTDLAVQLTRPGGVIAYVTPTSFLAGEYFKSLRKLLAVEASPANIDFIAVRKGIFEDVLQETLLAAYKRSGTQKTASVHFISSSDYSQITVERAGTFGLSVADGSPWLLPRSPDQDRLIAVLRGFRHRLKDYGYEVSTGPLVWNRHKSQLRSKPSADTLPLIWAECVTSDGEFIFRADKKNHQPYFKPIKGDEWLIMREPCVLLQRTTAKEQSRRLIAAQLPIRFLSEHGGVVVENHLNMIRPINRKPTVLSSVLVALLNSEIVDRAFRCISGSVAVSAYELEALPLPPPNTLKPLRNLLTRDVDREALEGFFATLFKNWSTDESAVVSDRRGNPQPFA